MSHAEAIHDIQKQKEQDAKDYGWMNHDDLVKEITHWKELHASRGVIMNIYKNLVARLEQQIEREIR